MPAAGPEGSDASRDAFAAAVRAPEVDLADACLLVAADFDEQLAPPGARAAWLTVLAELAAAVPVHGTPAERLRTALQGFAGTARDYDQLESSLLHEVLRRRRGLPILLSVVWLEVARRAGIPAYGLGLPGHFVVGVPAHAGRDDVLDVVDAFGGGAVLTRLAAAEAPVWGPVETVERILANIRRWAERPDRLDVRRKALELTLLLPRHSATVRREYGEVLVQVGRFAEGAAELEAFADAVEPVADDEAERVRWAARAARARLN
ncbi:MAG: tetratricopeptide repeat protein [Actinomycetota bacterium]|nr:tetratricopeptide repeat protein [Actinomycetota bacterium]